MDEALHELLGHEILQALHQLEWRFQTLEQDFEDCQEQREPEIEDVDSTFQFQKQGPVYEAEKVLHHFLSGYYTYWRQVVTVAHSTEDRECIGRVENIRDEHDEYPSIKVTRGLRMYVQKESVLPLRIYRSDHSDQTPRYAINKQDLYREGLYDPNYEHYFGDVDGNLIFPFETVSKGWEKVEKLHQETNEMMHDQMEDELVQYKENLERLEEIAENEPLISALDETVPSDNLLSDYFLDLDS